MTADPEDHALPPVSKLTSDEWTEVVRASIRDGKFEATIGLLKMMAVRFPGEASDLLDAIKIGIALRG